MVTIANSDAWRIVSGSVVAERSQPEGPPRDATHLGVQVGVVQHVEEVTRGRQGHVPVVGRERLLEVLAGGVEVQGEVVRAAEPEQETVTLFHGRRLPRARSNRRWAKAAEPASSATRPCSARYSETAASPEPGEASRCCATEPASSPASQRSRAARRVELPEDDIGQLRLDSGSQQRVEELDRVAVHQDAGDLEPRGFAARRPTLASRASSAA